MFKSFQNTSRANGFNGFPALNFQMNNEAYGFSGCTHWWDAAYGTNTITDSANVTYWQSKIGNSIAKQSTAANQPIYVAANTSFNNLPTINFNNDVKGFEFDSNQRIPINSKTTICIIYKINAASGTYNTMFYPATTSEADKYSILLRGITAGDGFGVYLQNDSNNIQTRTFKESTQDTNAHIGIVTSGNGNAIISLDNVQTSSGTWDRFTSYLYLSLGLTTRGVNANIAEILIYNRQLNSNEVSQLSTRINSKYAIY